MYFTQTELINLKILINKAQIDSSRLGDLIQRDMISPQKQHMSEGVNYYNSKNDILLHQNWYYLDGQKIEDLVKSNHKLPHPFLKILIDEKASYIAGNPIVINIAEPKIIDQNKPTSTEQKALDNQKAFLDDLKRVLGKKFNRVMTDWIKGSSKKAMEWIHFYLKPNGEFDYQIVPAEQIIPIYDTKLQSRLVGLIRYYTYDYINEKTGDLSKLNKVEWWTDKGVEYWEEQLGGTYIHDPDYDFNPGPHWFSFNTMMPSNKEKNFWGKNAKWNEKKDDSEKIGFIPFVPLFNNSLWHSDLQPIKVLIDTFDLVMSGWANDLSDFSELIYIIKNYHGISEASSQGLSELDKIVKNIKTHKIVMVDGEGDMKTIKADIPVAAREKFLAILQKEIYNFGQGIDPTDKMVRSDSSGIALKFLYSSLDLKANDTILQLETALEEFFWFVVYFINITENKKYDPSQINFVFNKSVIFNEQEKTAEMVTVFGKVSQKTFLSNLPFVDNVEEEQKQIEAEKYDTGNIKLSDMEAMMNAGKPSGGSKQPAPEPQQQIPSEVED